MDEMPEMPEILWSHLLKLHSIQTETSAQHTITDMIFNTQDYSKTHVKQHKDEVDRYQNYRPVFFFGMVRRKPTDRFGYFKMQRKNTLWGELSRKITFYKIANAVFGITSAIYLYIYRFFSVQRHKVVLVSYILRLFFLSFFFFPSVEIEVVKWLAIFGLNVYVAKDFNGSCDYLESVCMRFM